jgi:hypothetical protein
MKIRAITLNNSAIKSGSLEKSTRKTKQKNEKTTSTGSSLACMPAYYPVNFTAIQNSSKLRALFAYDLPCIYSGVTMVDPKQLAKWLKNKFFYRPSTEVLEVLGKYNNTFDDMEARLLSLLVERSAIHPDKNIKELIDEVKPVFSRRLRKKQTPIFHEILELSHELPEITQSKIKILIDDAEKRLDERPVLVPFSSYEFKYKLGKIKEIIVNGENLKAKKVMNKLIKESRRFSNTTNSKTEENQKQVVNFMEIILKTSVLKDNEQLKNLIEISKSRLNKDKIIVPFFRKNFLYDLMNIIKETPSSQLQEKIFKTAEKLPTSNDSFSAYVMKVGTEDANTIGQKIVWPYIASVEHLFPKSMGGANKMSNYAGATARENSMRKNIPFTQQMKLRPKTSIYVQKYIDRIIELYKMGVFVKINADPSYITDVSKTFYELSNHRIKIDLSKLYET